MAVRDDLSVIWALSPRIITIAAPSTEITIQDLHDTLRDIEDEPHAMAYPSLISTAGKEPLGGGVTVGLTATLQDAKIAFEARQVIRTSGTVTAGDTTGRVLTDTGNDFVAAGVTQGDWLVNMTDGSGCTVLFVTTTTLVTDVLDGGTDNQFDGADVYRIWPVIQVGVAGGNVVAIDAVAAELDPILATFGTQVVRTSSSSATLQELLDIQFSSFNGAVTVHLLSPYAGTLYPRGTPRQPVNNFADALVICTARGFTTINILGDATISAGAFQNFNFVGSGVTETSLTIDAGAQVDGASFTQAAMNGTLDGDVVIDNCVINDLTYVDGSIQNSTFVGTITLNGAQDTSLMNCRDGTPGTDFPHIDMGGSGSALNVQGWSGGIRIQNKTGPEAIAIGLVSGAVILDSSVTDGPITLSGVGTVINNSTGTAVVNTDGLVNKRDLFQQIVTGVYLDSVNGVSGTGEGVGLPQTPVNSIADARTIANRDGYTAYHIRGSFVLDQAYTNWTFQGVGEILSEIDFNGQTVTGSIFSLCSVTGAMGTGPIEIIDGRLRAATNLAGVFRDCGVPNTFSVAASATVVFNQCFSGAAALGSAVLSVGAGASVSFRDWAGGVDVRGVTAGADVSVDSSKCHVTLGPTNTGGTIVLRGTGLVSDTTAGTTVVNEMLTAQVALLLKHAGNRLEVDFAAQELVLYNDDNVTPLRRWPLGTQGTEPVATATGVQTKRQASVI